MYVYYLVRCISLKNLLMLIIYSFVSKNEKKRLPNIIRKEKKIQRKKNGFATLLYLFINSNVMRAFSFESFLL